MKREQRWLAVALLGMSVLFAGCASRSEGGEEAAADEISNATVVHSEGSQPSRVTLTEDAAAKIDVQTVLAQDERVNGETRTAPTPLTVLELLRRAELLQRRVAVAINAEVVPKSRFAEVLVRDGDKVEVIHAVGGGA